MLKHLKIGFMGMGNMAQAMIKGLIESKSVEPKNIFGSNRTPGKLIKAVETWGINSCPTNEQLIESSDIIILAMKPQDLLSALDQVASIFIDKQIVISLAAGIRMDSLEKKLPNCRVVRLIPNTPTLLGKGVLGYLLPAPDNGLEVTIQDLCQPLGYITKMEDEDQLEALMVTCSSGVGFIYEFMIYFQDWIEERGFPPEVAQKMVIETFAGASLLASHNKDIQLTDLQAKVASKKGVTQAGLQSMRELEIERLLRYSFEKAALRNQELAKENK